MKENPSSHSSTSRPASASTLPPSQRGFIFVLTLVIMVAMTLIGIAVARSASSAGGIAVTLGFKKSTLMSSDRALEAGIAWLSANSNILVADCPGQGYYANAALAADYAGSATTNFADDINWSRAGMTVTGAASDSTTGACSAAFTGSNSPTAAVYVVANTSVPDATVTAATAATVAADSVGNVGSYIIQRLCDGSGAFSASSTISCAGAASQQSEGASTGAVSYGSYSVTGATQLYYRITARSVGPRGTSTYSQAKVLMNQ